MKTAAKIRKPLPVEEDMHLQRAIWTAERVGWITMAAVIALAILGAFSQGLLSSTETASAQGPMKVLHERILREGRAHDFIVTQSGLEPRAESGIAILDHDFGSLPIESIVPQPLSHEAGLDVTRFRFRADRDGGLKIVFRIRPATPGRGRLVFAADDEAPLIAKFFTLP
jgi:hypothetical protein